MSGLQYSQSRYLGRLISFHYDSDNLLTAITAPGLDGATRTVVRFHYKPVNLFGALCHLDPYSPHRASTRYTFLARRPDIGSAMLIPTPPVSGIIAKVSQRRGMTLNKQGRSTNRDCHRGHHDP